MADLFSIIHGSDKIQEAFTKINGNFLKFDSYGKSIDAKVEQFNNVFETIGYPQSLAINGGDANEMRTTMKRFIFNVSNTPAGTDYGLLEVLKLQSGGFSPSAEEVVIQRFTFWWNGKHYTRAYRKDGSDYKWSEWECVPNIDIHEFPAGTNILSDVYYNGTVFMTNAVTYVRISNATDSPYNAGDDDFVYVIMKTSDKENYRIVAYDMRSSATFVNSRINGTYTGWSPLTEVRSTDITFYNAWLQYDVHQTCCVTRIGNTCSLHGLIRKGLTDAGTIVLQVPAMYRPKTANLLVNNTYGFYMKSDGYLELHWIRYSESEPWYVLDGLTWEVD